MYMVFAPRFEIIEEALEEMLDANPELGSREGTADGTLRIQRARYSALTKEEIERAFNELDTLSYPLANAGAVFQNAQWTTAAPSACSGLGSVLSKRLTPTTIRCFESTSCW